MIGPIGLTWFAWAALACAAVGAGLIVLRQMARTLDPDADFVRAFLVTGVALGVTHFAFAAPAAWLWWASGFVVCAAVHRWFDAFSQRAGAPAAETVSARSTKPKKSKT